MSMITITAPPIVCLKHGIVHPHGYEVDAKGELVKGKDGCYIYHKENAMGCRKCALEAGDRANKKPKPEVAIQEKIQDSFPLEMIQGTAGFCEEHGVFDGLACRLCLR
jgi:hypothetical protein